MAGWFDNLDWGMGTQQVGVPQKAQQSSLLNEQITAPPPVTADGQVGAGAPVRTLTTKTFDPYASWNTPANRKETLSLSAGDMAKNAAINTASGMAKAVVEGASGTTVDATTHNVVRIMVGALGLVLISIGGLLFGAGAIASSPGASSIAEGRRARKDREALRGISKSISESGSGVPAWLGNRGEKKPPPVIREKTPELEPTVYEKTEKVSSSPWGHTDTQIRRKRERKKK